MMMKKLIPAAALLVVMGAAQAQVTVYGLIDASYGKNEFLGDTSATFHSGGDNSSSQGNSATKFGIKGSTDVGSGYKANFKLESGGITSNGEVNPTGYFFNRAAWVGFSGGFGEVRLGRQDSVPFQTMIDFDFNGAANAASAQGNVGVGSWGQGRQSRSLQYIAPAMGGLTAQAGFVPEDTAAATKAIYSLGLKYTAGKLVIGAASQSASTDASSSFTSVAASYDFGVAKAMVSYADGGTNAKGTSVGVSAPVGGFTVGVTYAKNSDTTYAATEFYINREILKNTYGYLDIGQGDTAGGSKNAYALGVIYVF